MTNAEIPRADGPVPPQVEPKCTAPYSIKTVWNCTMQMNQMLMYPPNWDHLYRALLHQDSMIYYRIHWYLVPIDLPNWVHLYRALLNQDSMTLQNADVSSANWPSDPPWIEPKCREPYYASIVWHCRMQMYQVPMYPPTPPSVQRPTTPAQYDIAEWRCTQCQSTPQQSPYRTKCYRDVLQ